MNFSVNTITLSIESILLLDTHVIIVEIMKLHQQQQQQSTHKVACHAIEVSDATMVVDSHMHVLYSKAWTVMMSALFVERG